MSAETAPIAPMGPEVPGQAPPNMQKLELVPNPWETPQPSSDSEWLGGVAPEGPQPSNLDRVPLSEVLPPAEQQAKTGKIKKLGHFITGKFAKVTEVTEAAPDPHSEMMAAPLQDKADMGNVAPLWPPAGFKNQVSSEQTATWKSLAEQAGLYDNPAPVIEQEPAKEREEVATQAEAQKAPKDLSELAAGASDVERLKHAGYVKEAPRFADILTDETRTNTFKYAQRITPLGNQDPSSHNPIIEMTEHEGLVALNDFLDSFAASESAAPHADKELVGIARGLQENLTFIGEKEYNEAVKGLAGLWKAYLEENPKLQLCVPTEISKNELKRKSDDFLRENILAHFSEHELEKYSGRIVTGIDEIDQSPENTKIIMLDDWSVSGTQMRQAYHSLTKQTEDMAGDYRNSFEIHMIAGSSDQINAGLSVKHFDKTTRYLPIKAYFQAHDAPKKLSRYKHPVTGTHSAVDFDFEDELGHMARQLSERTGVLTTLPPLANIVRSYRFSRPLFSFQHRGKITRNKV